MAPRSFHNLTRPVTRYSPFGHLPSMPADAVIYYVPASPERGGSIGTRGRPATVPAQGSGCRS